MVSELSCLLGSGSAFGRFLSSERGRVSASLPAEQEPCTLLKVSLEFCSLLGSEVLACFSCWSAGR